MSALDDLRTAMTADDRGLRGDGSQTSSHAARSVVVGPDDWYRDAVIYQLHVRSFADSNADGTGDFDGLTERLDYLVDLGVDTLWLLPFFPSPLRDDGYDIADYRGIHPAYGDMAAFRRFLAAAHARGLRVIIELVLNHTSDQHPWFQRARRAPRGSRYRNFYVWSDTPDLYDEARIIFQDFESSNWSWDPVAHQYYWHRFYSHQPDLNFESPDVRRSMFATIGRWMRMGVDGVRLDAVPYLFEAAGTNCENLPETHRFLRQLRAHLDEHFPGRLLLAEANQWPEDAVAYFGEGDECHMAFHFPVMPRLFMGVQMESRTPIVDILEQTPDIPDGCQWAMFLRNHDELTLEMVTDEERDYMYRRFAGDPRMRINLGIRRRLGPLLQDDRRKVELMNGLLFSLPGTPIVYYGDEIGMGDNVYLGDRDAVRTPMQWSADRNGGFSRCNPQQLFLPLVIDPQHHFEAVNVEAQRANPASLWWWMRRLIALRKRHRVFGRGRMEIVDSDNTKVLSFLRTIRSEHLAGPDALRGGNGESLERDEDVLVVANLSRHVQGVTLTLPPGYDGVRPVELFGRTELDPVEGDRYRLTLGPHDFFWLRLNVRVPEGVLLTGEMPVLGGASVAPPLPLLSHQPERAVSQALARALPRFLVHQRWFGNHSRSITDVSIVDTVPLRPLDAAGVLADVEFSTGEPQRYFIPVAGGTDGLDDPMVVSRLVRMIVGSERLAGTNGTLVGALTDKAPEAIREARLLDPAVIRPLGAEQSNSSHVVDELAVLKVLRRVDPGVHPEVEMLDHLTARRFPNAPRLYGTISYRRPGQEHPTSLATLTQFVPSDGDMWKVFRFEAARFVEHAAANPDGITSPSTHPDHDEHRGQLPEPLGEALHLVQLLGGRTYDLHRELASINDDRFRPVAFTRLYQRSLYQAMRSHTRATYAAIGRARHAIDSACLEVLPAEQTVLARFAALTDHLVECDRIRVHGDLHLAQVLERGGDVTFIDFEGEPARPLGERSIKRSALVDVAGMIRSFDYVARQGMRDAVDRGVGVEADLDPFAERWGAWAAESFVAAYLDEARIDHDRAGDEVVGPAGAIRLVPADPTDVALLLDAFVLQKALSEVVYELDNRPRLAWIPIRALERAITAWQGRSLHEAPIPLAAAAQVAGALDS